MNTAELTALHNETIASFDKSFHGSAAADRHNRLLVNIARRAETLFSDGYAATQTMNGLYAACFQVISPAGKRYAVKVSKTQASPGTFYGSKCSCPCFAEVGTCKHLQACTWQVEKDAHDEAQADAYDATAADREAHRFDTNDYEFRNFCEAVN